MSRIAFHRKGARRASICSPMSGDIGVDAGDPAQHGHEQELVMVGEMPVERSAQLILLLYLDKRGRPKVRIHGRPRSDRKRRFLLSAVAPSTSTRHPREARPINWAQRGGLASGRGNTLLTPRPHFTAHHARLVTRWFVLRTALLFVGSAVRLVYAERIARVDTPKVKATWQPNEIQIEVNTAPRKPEGWQGYFNKKVKEFGSTPCTTTRGLPAMGSPHSPPRRTRSAS